MSEPPPFSSYAYKVILASCVLDSQIFDQYWSFLPENFFPDKHYRKVAQFLTEQAQSTEMQIHPDPSLLMEEMERTASEDEKEIFRAIFNDLIVVNLDQFKLVEPNLKEMIRRRALEDAIEESRALIERGDFDEAASIVAEAAQVTITKPESSKDFFLSGAEQRLNRRTDPSQNTQRLPMVIGVTDRFLKGGGLGPGTLTTIIGATGFGKSMALVHLARMAVLHGMKALYLTLELSRADVEDRFDAAFSGILSDNLEGMADKVKEEVQMRCGKYGDSLRIMEYGEYSISVEAVPTILRDLGRDGFVPDVICIDYADLMKPPKMTERRFQLSYIYTSLHEIAKRLNTRIVTASQTNRSGIEKKVVTLVDFAEDISKAWASDYIFTICQTLEEQMVSKARLYIAKNRTGQKNKSIEFKQDYTRAIFAVPSLSTARDLTPEDLYGTAQIDEPI